MADIKIYKLKDLVMFKKKDESGYIQELRDHVAKEPEWIELIIADRINMP